MVYDAITVEPGIYHDGWFGIRIEDDFLVNQDGYEFLTETIPRDLDWFMITHDDYEPMEVIEVTEEDEGFLPFPAGIIEIILISTIVVAIRNPEDYESL
jgi:hypothetical protein